MKANLIHVPFEKVLEIDELQNDADRRMGQNRNYYPEREWYFYDTVPYGVGGILIAPKSHSVLLGPVWVAKEYRGKGLSSFYSNMLLELGLRKTPSDENGLKKATINALQWIVPVHVKHGWKYIGSKDTKYEKDVYGVLEKTFKEIEGDFYRLQDNGSFIQVTSVLRRDDYNCIWELNKCK